MPHAALTPLLGKEFDSFLFAPIDDEAGGPSLSVVSALARLDLDPWSEAVGLARMPDNEAMKRLTTLIASLPKGLESREPPEAIAARLISLLPKAARFEATVRTTISQVAPRRRLPAFLGLGALALLLVVYFALGARSPDAPRSVADAPAASHESATKR